MVESPFYCLKQMHGTMVHHSTMGYHGTMPLLHRHVRLPVQSNEFGAPVARPLRQTVNRRSGALRFAADGSVEKVGS
jgi:hypothetical protein